MMFDEINTSLRELLEARSAAGKHDGSPGGKKIPVEMKRWFGDVIMNILLKIIIGKRCVGPNAGDGVAGEKQAKDFQMAIRDSFHLMGQGLLSDYVPVIGRLGLFNGQVKVMENIAKRFDIVLSEWVEEHKRNRALSCGDKKDEDFMDALVSLYHGKEIEGSYDADTIIKATTLVHTL